MGVEPSEERDYLAVVSGPGVIILDDLGGNKDIEEDEDVKETEEEEASIFFDDVETVIKVEE